MAVTLNPVQSASDPDQTFLGVKISHLEDAVEAAVFHEIVQIVAQRYVDAHFTEIMAKLDQNAIASLAVAECAKKIAEEIQRRPVMVHVDKRGKGSIRDL